MAFEAYACGISLVLRGREDFHPVGQGDVSCRVERKFHGGLWTWGHIVESCVVFTMSASER